MKTTAPSGNRNPLDPGLVLVLTLTLFAAIPLLSDDVDVLYHSYRLVCGGGMYLFVKRRCGRLGAVMAGLLYVYSPDMFYARGSHPELLARALFPWLLWRVDVLRDQPAALNFVWLVLFQAALFYAHPFMALILTLITLAWVICEALVNHLNRESSRMDWRPAAIAAVGILLGMGLSASSWLPPLHDASLINGRSEPAIAGIAQATLALAGFVGAGWLYIRGYRSRHPQAYLGMIFFALAALMLPMAAAACLAIVAGMNGLWLRRLRPRIQIGLIALLAALPMVSSIPLFAVPATTGEHSLRLLSGAPPELDTAAWLSLLMAWTVAWLLRRWRLTARPYWRVAPLSRAEIGGILLGAALALLGLLLIA